MPPTSCLRRELPRIGRGAFLAALLMLAGPARAAPPGPKPEAKEAADQLRAFLPTLRHKALLDNEREYAAALQKALRLYRACMDGGLVGVWHVNRVEEEVLRAGARALRREAEYLDS